MDSKTANAGEKEFTLETCTFECETLTDVQKNAIVTSLNSHISLITGRAGTGKTTVINELVINLNKRKIKFRLASFTGKAVARIREVTGIQNAQTLHMMIARKVPPFDVLIIDEASMVTTQLVYEFGKVYAWDFKVIFVGDNYQLQPIGWGSLFDQLISCSGIPKTELLINHRSDILNVGEVSEEKGEEEINGLLVNASGLIKYHQEKDKLLDGQVLQPFGFTPYKNFVILPNSIETVQKIVKKLADLSIPSTNITVITPFNKYLDQLNSFFRKIYKIGDSKTIDYLDRSWQPGDRVMMTENNYSINVMNGEEGIVSSVTETHIFVIFRGSEYKFSVDEPTDTRHDVSLFTNLILSQEEKLNVKTLTHSFAVTIHKAQGSEWEYVILYVPKFPTSNAFINWQMIYTAITRARKGLFVVADQQTLCSGLLKSPGKRYDGLAKMIR